MSVYSIYKVTNLINGKVYIGFTSNFPARKRLHKHNSLKNKNYVFHNAIRKYGWNNFDWQIIYQSKDKNYILAEMEQYFINEFSSLHPIGYNMKTGGSGGNLSESARLKISQKRKGIKFSDKHIEKLRESHRGKIMDDSHKSKISESLKRTLKLQTKVKCPFCNMSGRKSNMTRYHFDNCKFKTVER
jgi:group I intron endonuclease